MDLEKAIDFKVDIFDNSPLAFCVIKIDMDGGKPKDWHFVYCNDALARLEGISKEELLSKSFYEIFPEGSHKWLGAYYRAAYHMEPQSFDDISEEIGIYLHIDVVPTGREGYCACILRDVKQEFFERAERNTALRDALEMAESANNVKSDFLEMMSNDICDPMNEIIGTVDLASANIDDTERVRESLRQITGSSRHLLEIINQVLDLSKVATGRTSLMQEKFNLSQLSENLISLLLPQVRARFHSFAVDTSGLQHELVIGDHRRLQQVLVNIITNAIRYTPDHGSITLVIKEGEKDANGKAGFQFICQDNGVGMSKEYLPQLFVPFSRATDPKVADRQGRGLGMAISRNIVHMMGGEILAESQLNKGTTITVSIAMQLQAEEKTPSLEKLAGLRVLVANEDEVSREACVTILQELGMETVAVGGGFEAVQEIVNSFRSKHSFDACILDWKLPDMNGLETAHNMQKIIGRHMPKVIVSAYDAKAVEEQARRAGATALISRPFFRSKLASLFVDIISTELAGEGSGSHNMLVY